MSVEINLFLKRFKKHFIFSLLTIGCVLLIYFNASNYGIGISADASHYISISKNILKDFSFYSSITEWDYEGIKNWNGFWPQLFPVILTVPVLLTKILGEIPIIIFNGFLLALTAILTYILMRRISTAGKRQLIAVVTLIVFSKWMLWTFIHVWTESVFTPLVIFYFIVFDDFLRDESDRNLNRLLVIVALLSVTRYIGVMFFLPIMVIAVYTRFILNSKRVVFFILAGIPFCTNIFINYLFTKNLFGVRSPSETSFSALLSRLSEGVTLWFFGIRFSPLLELVIALLLAVAIGFILLNVWRNSKPLTRIIISTSILFFILLILFIVSAKVENFTFRYISPIFIPMSLLIFSWLLNLKQKNLVRIILLLLLVPSMFITLRYSALNHSRGIGVFSTKEWRNSPTIEYLKRIDNGNLIYSNYPDAINYLTDLPAKMITDKEDRIEEMLKRVETENGTLVLFNIKTRRDPMRLELLQNKLSIAKKEILKDGIIYFLNK